MGEQQATQGDQTQGTQQPGGPDLTIRDGMSAADVKTLLQKERDRDDMQRKAEIEKAVNEGVNRAKAEAEEAARLAALDETERAIEAKKSAEAERDQARAETAALEGRIARGEFLNEHAGGLDKAWRSYLDGQLTAAEPEDWEDTLKRVLADHAQSTGRKPGDVGTGGRPAATTTPETINQKIRSAMGRR